MEAPIVFGLKRPASDGLVAGAGTGQRSDRGGTAVKVAALCGAAVAWGRRSSGWLASWAAGRSISPNTLSGIWPLAVTTLISIGTSELLGACWRAALGAGDPGESDRITVVRRWTGKILGLPAGLRGLLALLAFAAAGAPAALFTVLAVEVVAVTATIAMLGKIRPPRWWTGLPVPASPFPAEPPAVWPATVRPVAVRPVAVRPAAARSPAAGSRRDGSATAAGASGAPAQAPAARVTASAGATGSPGATAAGHLNPP